MPKASMSMAAMLGASMPQGFDAEGLAVQGLAGFAALSRNTKLKPPGA